MRKICIFTIVAKNYIGLAQLLELSLKRVNPELEFKIVVADSFVEPPKDLPSNVLIAKDILPWGEEKLLSMAFKYDLTEFCTSLKPGCILHFFKEGYEEVIYFDPDIFIFSSINPIIVLLEKYQIVLTPHIARIHTIFNGDHPEWMINCNGIFNLGFIGVRKTPKTITFLEWWDQRLENDCFADRIIGDFTDQKWMDWTPAFFTSEEFYSSPYLGMNVAPWNFFEREVIEKDGSFKVKPRNEISSDTQLEDLIFVHFSGFKYKLLKEGIIGHKRNDDLEKYSDLYKIYTHYGNFIKSHSDIFDKYIDQSYTYNFFENGMRIDPFQRRLFNGLTKEGQQFKNPFSVDEESFYSILRKEKIFSKNTSNSFSRSSVKNMSSKVKLINKFYRLLFKIVGYTKYVLLTKSHIDYCRPEKHTFLFK